MVKKNLDVPTAQNPLIIRCHRLMEAFAKSNDERDFYLDRQEGFLVYVDLDKSQEEIDVLLDEIASNSDRYVAVPKLTYYEIKKVMEGFVTEKVYDIDTKEKLMDIIGSKEARENFLEFIYDHETELERWQQYYQERFRVRIIEWLRKNHFDFVFEEDLELTQSAIERLKMNLFTDKPQKEIVTLRKTLQTKAKSYYTTEALNPRPKRGRPPKQVVKVETEPQFSQDIFTTVPKSVKPFLFIPDYQAASFVFTFSGKFDSEAELLAYRRQQIGEGPSLEMQSLQDKLSELRTLSGSWGMKKEQAAQNNVPVVEAEKVLDDDKGLDLSELDVMSFEELMAEPLAGIFDEPKSEKSKEKAPIKKPAAQKTPAKKAPVKKAAAAAPKKAAAKKPQPKSRLRPLPKKEPKTTKKVAEKKTTKKVAPKRHLRQTKKAPATPVKAKKKK